MALRSRSRVPVIAPEHVAGRPAITRAAAGIGLYAGAFGVTFSAVAVRGVARIWTAHVVVEKSTAMAVVPL